MKQKINDEIDYWELRKLVSKIIPRRTQLFSSKNKVNAVKEKGRKTNYHQYNIEKREWLKHERLLNLEEVNSFLEISVRAAACPMPLNLDVWDGLLCVVEGQRALTKRGWIPIEKIKIGDEVLSYNESNLKMEWKEVTQTSSTEKENLIEIDTGEEKLLVTDDHPVYTQRGWVLAKNLTENDILLTYRMEFKNTKSIKKIKKKTKVYDITIKDNENFFAEGILVHNCPFACRYCFADAFRASLYTAFFDNSKSMGLRHCNPDYYKRELDKLMKNRGNDPHTIQNDVKKAVAMELPMRMGIRFEDFTKAEERKGVSLEMIKYLSSIDYPIMLNTKSDLPGRGEYVKALASNKAAAAVHITMITSDEKILRKIEPGAPSFAKRLESIKNLTDAGVRAVPRIEPYLAFITDERDAVEEYIEKIYDAGARHMTFDTYSYSANNPGIKAAFVKQGYDFERFFILGCDSQALGSLLLDKFMDLFRAKGISCSSFDMGCAPRNNQDVCCEVGDLFKGGFNYGSTVMAARYIVSRGKVPTRWRDFAEYVNNRGGFLSEKLKRDVHLLWNVKGNNAYSHNWAAGVEPYGADEDGVVWYYREDYDHRIKLLKGLI